MTSNLEIQVENIDHLGLVAGMIDEIGILNKSVSWLVSNPER